MFFFIDELDRCNPHFAIKLLERVKHLFEVPNIIFVLAVNIDQLQYAVQGFYGSSNIDGKQYLKRFIDIEYSLPAPNLEEYCKFMFGAYDFNSFLIIINDAVTMNCIWKEKCLRQLQQI